MNKQELGKLKRPEFTECQNKIAKTFVRELQVGRNQKKVEKITKLYEKLFTMTLVSNYFSKVVSTNYDNTFEIFCNNSTSYKSDDFKKYLNQRGFKSENSEQKFCLQSDPDTEVSFLKLHGSLDWWKNKEGTEIILNESGKSYGRNLGKRLMIYPIHDKYISEFPFYYTYNCFKNILKNDKYQCVVVIGYSFRDESINNAFKNRFLFETGDKDEFELLICNKSEEVRNRVNKIFSGAKYKIEFLNSNFGEDDFISSLSKKLKS